MYVALLITNSLIPAIMIIFGLLWKNNPPRSINWVYGYRTPMSMKNLETWKFAHSHNAKIWRWSGLIWFVISAGLMIIFKNEYEKVSERIMLIGLAIMVLSLIPTEIALRRKFDKDGNLR